jgi:hypothetical protein
MVGIGLCTKGDFNVTAIGFAASLSNNLFDCCQNVLSKVFLETTTPESLQLNTSVAATLFQLPMLLFYMRESAVQGGLDDRSSAVASSLFLFIDCLSFHAQVLLAFISVFRYRRMGGELI